MYATVAEIKAVLPADSLTDQEISSLLDLAAQSTGDNHEYHFNKTVKLAVSKLRLAGKLPDSATVGPLKTENKLKEAIEGLSGTEKENRIPFLYYKKVGSNEDQ